MLEIHYKGGDRMVSGDSHGSDGRTEMYDTTDDDHVLKHDHSVC